MKSHSIYFTTLMLAAPVALWLQGSALAQATGGTITPAPPAQGNDARAGTNGEFRDNVDFYFPGGNPRQFLRAVDEQYHVDWMSVADIPGNMQQVQIPALRMSRESMSRIPARGRGLRAGRGGGRGGGGAAGAPAATEIAAAPDAGAPAMREPLEALVALYDSLGLAKPELGELRVVGDLAKPSIVLLRAIYQPATTPDFKMKAFALKGIPESEWDGLAVFANQELGHLADVTWSPQVKGATQVTLHRDPGLLIVFGPESALQAAESLVTAWRDNHSSAPLPDNHSPAVPPTISLPVQGR
jgi:hypothetical protein